MLSEFLNRRDDDHSPFPETFLGEAFWRAAKHLDSIDAYLAWTRTLLRALRQFDVEIREVQERLDRRLAALRIKEAEWNAAKHPRLGTSPNPGWFASTGGIGIAQSPAGAARDISKAPKADSDLHSRRGSASGSASSMASPDGLNREVAQNGAELRTGEPSLYHNISTSLAGFDNASGKPIARTAAVPRSVKLADAWGSEMEKTLGKFGLSALNALEHAPKPVKEALANALANYVKKLIDQGESASAIRDFLNGTPTARDIIRIPKSLRGPGLEFSKEGNRYTLKLKPSANVRIEHGRFEAGIGFSLSIAW